MTMQILNGSTGKANSIENNMCGDFERRYRIECAHHKTLTSLTATHFPQCSRLIYAPVAMEFSHRNIVEEMLHHRR